MAANLVASWTAGSWMSTARRGRRWMPEIGDVRWVDCERLLDRTR